MDTDVCYNFLYRRCTTVPISYHHLFRVAHILSMDAGPRALNEILCRYRVGRRQPTPTAYVRNSLPPAVLTCSMPDFDWSSNALWYEDIPNARDPAKTMFILGGKDSIVEAKVCSALCPLCHNTSIHFYLYNSA